ncbi:hypothetical protein EP51_45220 (plasmid) [Rhodococcus opacus]|uniref:Uncharacterized protein n=1 Tax=Rhodococcus opacus TaxID=37919 RepID=A0A076EZL9_RHOOP|nr:hypothetical protein EP51_45220 [Rhodococcus opacus]
MSGFRLWIGGQRPKSERKNPGFAGSAEFSSQVHRLEAGTDFMTLPACWPQPPQVVFVQLGQVVG